MDFQNAKEVMESKGYIDVEYRSKAVMLEQIFEEKNCALVKEVDSDKRFYVSLSDLVITDHMN